MKGIISVNIYKCMACKSCELECAIAHSKYKNLFEAIQETPSPQTRIRVEGKDGFSIPLQCRHCEDAFCVQICPTKAVKKIDPKGPVIIKDDLCIGCKCCILVCPFGVIDIGLKGRVAIKCDLCFERLEKGQLPACVKTCPTKALCFIPLESKRKGKEL